MNGSDDTTDPDRLWVVMFRCTTQEHRALLARAEAEGLHVSEYVRRKLTMPLRPKAPARRRRSTE